MKKTVLYFSLPHESPVDELGPVRMRHDEHQLISNKGVIKETAAYPVRWIGVLECAINIWRDGYEKNGTTFPGLA